MKYAKYGPVTRIHERRIYPGDTLNLQASGKEQAKETKHLNRAEPLYQQIQFWYIKKLWEESCAASRARSSRAYMKQKAVMTGRFIGT